MPSVPQIQARPSPELYVREWSPSWLPNMAAWYESLSGRNLSKDGSNRISLLWDISGESDENALVLTGSSGSSAMTPASTAINVTGDFAAAAELTLPSWVPSGSSQAIMSRDIAPSARCWFFSIQPTTGVLRFTWWPSGTNTPQISVDSTVAPAVAAFGRLWVAARLIVNNGAGNYEVRFYTSTDGAAWTQLGASVVGSGVTSLPVSTTALSIGTNATASSNFLAGRVHRVVLFSGDLTGTRVFDVDFSKASRLAASLVEDSANHATVTINTSGDTGARICGPRDLYQGTGSKQGVWAANLVTVDGVNDYWKTPAFSLAQPITFYALLKQIAWAANKRFTDGNSTTERMVIRQDAGGGVSPQISMYAGTDLRPLNGPAVGALGVVTAVFNGANSQLRTNEGAALVGSAGALSANGLTVGADFGGLNNGNFAVGEILMFAAAHSTAVQDQIIGYLARKWGIAL